jgi:hypothetical protein
MAVTPWLLSFGGGIFGAVFGGTGAFFLCGLAAIIGGAITLATGRPGFDQFVTWGPFLGPHVAFAGGVAAAAMAARKGLIPSGRDVSRPLFGLSSPIVLLTGGLFGVLGLGWKTLADWLPASHGLPWVNSIAVSIILNGFLVRLLIGRKGLMPRAAAGKGRMQADSEAAWEPWLGHPPSLILIAAAVSLFSGAVVKPWPAAIGLVFGLAAFTLLFLFFGAHIPIILHVAWSAGYAVLLTGDLGWGIIFGILAAVLADLLAGLFLLRGDTHIDPPAMAVAITYFLTPPSVASGLPAVLAGPVSFLAAAALGAGAIFLLGFLRRRRS